MTLLKKSIHIILAFFLLISTSGFSINTHFCQNQLQDLQVFCQAKTCGELQAEKESCHKVADENIKSCKKGCCESKSDFHQLDLDQQTVPTTFKPLSIKVLTAVLFTLLNIELPSADQKSTDYFNYKPPLIICNYTAELQTFLI
ncbi:MAG: hypothetical protein AB8H03_00425 [Saprospiraceae bacterium]